MFDEAVIFVRSNYLNGSGMMVRVTFGTVFLLVLCAFFKPAEI